MSNIELVDLANMKIGAENVLFFEPNLRGYFSQLSVWYNQAVMNTSEGNGWGQYVTFADLTQFFGSALTIYTHLSHSEVYVSRQCYTESPSKLKKVWGSLVIPRYIRDMIREIARPMELNGTTIYPYVRPVLPGVAPANGFGVKPVKFKGVESCLKNMLRGGLWDDFVPIEAEAPKISPFFIATDSSVLLFVPSVPSWRLTAISVLRHVRRHCRLFDIWPRDRDVPDVDRLDDRFHARSLIRDGFDAVTALPPLGDQSPGDVFLGNYQTDRRSLEKALRLALSNAQGPVPPLPDSLLERSALLVAYAVGVFTQRLADEIAVGDDPLFVPGLPEPRVVRVNYRTVNFTVVNEKRFPSFDDNSQTPPSSPATKKGKRKRKKGIEKDVVVETAGSTEV